MTIDPKEVSVSKIHGYLLGAIAPRPIAFASTIDKNGNVNLSPYSFFNVFSANPPIVVFSPSRRVRDNTTKHTLENIREVPEVVINIANYDMVQQLSLASTEYPKGVNEFIKAGFTEKKASRVKPPLVAEAPVSFECIVKDIIELGTEGGAGNLVICEVVYAHINDAILDENARINPYKLDAVSRMGGDWYCRAQGDAIFEVAKPLQHLGIGMDAIPESILKSEILTGNDLGMLANVERLPDTSSVSAFKQSHDYIHATTNGQNAIHQYAKQLLREGRVEDAWKALL